MNFAHFAVFLALSFVDRTVPKNRHLCRRDELIRGNPSQTHDKTSRCTLIPSFRGRRQERLVAFYVVASQYFATLIQERLVVLGCCLLALLTKFQGKLVHLQQVSNPNSQDNFQIYCVDMCLVRFLANLAGFHVFW